MMSRENLIAQAAALEEFAARYPKYSSQYQSDMRLEAAALRDRAAALPQGEPVAGHCVEGNRCVCGGDTPGVRAGCHNWRKAPPPPGLREAFEVAAKWALKYISEHQGIDTDFHADAALIRRQLERES